MRGILLLMIVAVLGLTNPSYAGVVVTDTEGSVIMIQDGKVKHSGGGQEKGSLILYPAKNMVIIVNDRDKTYIQTTPDEFCNAIKAKMHEMMEAIPPAQRRMMEEMGMGRTHKVKIRVEEAGNGGSIAGYNTVKYNVYKNDELFQEIWIAKGTPVEREIRDIKDIVVLSKKVEECAKGMGVMNEHMPLLSSKEYQRIFEKGWVMKRVTHYTTPPMMAGGQRAEVIEVEGIEERGIPSSEFQPPKGYRRISIREMFRIQE